MIGNVATGPKRLENEVGRCRSHAVCCAFPAFAIRACSLNAPPRVAQRRPVDLAGALHLGASPSLWVWLMGLNPRLCEGLLCWT
jgi:hypothetical protein